MFRLNENVKETVEASRKKRQEALTTSISPQTHTLDYFKIYKDKDGFDIFHISFI